MASLLEIKKKIGSVKNMRKITKAMQLVAASKMRTFQKNAVSSREYIWDYLEILHSVANEKVQSTYTQSRPENSKKLFVLYTSDKGLCGALNTQLMKALFQSSEWKDTPKEDRLLITIGKKAFDFAKSNKIPVEREFVKIKEKFGLMDLLPIMDAILSYWNEEKCGQVFFVAPHYKNSFTFYPVLKSFLPFSQTMIKQYVGVDPDLEVSKEERRTIGYTYFEPSEEKALEDLVLRIIEGAFIQSLYELKASEYSSRMIAMQNATDAANKMIDRLTTTYNKTRQQAITQQISEIVNAGEAMAA